MAGELRQGAFGTPVSPSQRRFLLVLGLPAFGISLAYTIVTAYVPVLLGELSGPTLTGALIGCEGLLALVIPPLIGGWSDRSTSRIGNRLPFILVGAALAITSLVLMPLGDGSLLWVSSCLIGFFVAYFVYYAPYYALYPDLVPSNVRGRSQGIQGALRSAGLLVAMGTGGLMLAAWQELPFVIASVVVLTVTAGLFLDIRGRTPWQSGHSDRDGFAGSFDLLQHSPAVRRWVTANALWEAAIGSLRTFVVLYFTVGLGVSLQETSAALMLVGVGALIAAPVAGRLADRYGARPVMRVAIWVFAAGLLPPLFTSSTTYAIAIVPVAFAAVVLMTLPYTMLMGLLPSGSQAHGAGAGLWGVSRGVGVLVGPLLAGLATELSRSLDLLSFGRTHGFASIFGVSALLLLASLPLLRRIDDRVDAVVVSS